MPKNEKDKKGKKPKDEDEDEEDEEEDEAKGKKKKEEPKANAELQAFIGVASKVPNILAFGEVGVATNVNGKDLVVVEDLYKRPIATLVLEPKTTRDLYEKLKAAYGDSK